MQSNEQGQEEQFIYDHRGNLLDVLTKVEGLAPAAPTHDVAKGAQPIDLNKGRTFTPRVSPEQDAP